jgi:hypothetical protein
MAAIPAAQERIGTMVMVLGSILIAGMAFMNRPAPGEFAEAEPPWYVTFNLVLHGAILLLLLVALTRLQKVTADRPGLRGLFLVMILVGIAAAADVVGVDLNWV